MPSIESPSLAPFELTLGAATGTAAAAVQAEVLELFDSCAPGLHRYIQSHGLTAEAADDVVQEVFLALFRHLTLGGERTNLRGWVVRVSHRLAIKHRQRLRRRTRHERPWLPHLDDAAVGPDTGPEARLTAGRRGRRLRAAVKALPARDQQCLFLRAEGLRYRDIAATLGVSLGTVAKSLARAVMRLSNAVRE